MLTQVATERILGVYGDFSKTSLALQKQRNLYEELPSGSNMKQKLMKQANIAQGDTKALAFEKAHGFVQDKMAYAGKLHQETEKLASSALAKPEFTDFEKELITTRLLDAKGVFDSTFEKLSDILLQYPDMFITVVS